MKKFEKGMQVLIDIEAYKMNRAVDSLAFQEEFFGGNHEMYIMFNQSLRNTVLMGVNNTINFPAETLKRAKKGLTFTITEVVDKDYVNLRCNEDGFECGCNPKSLIKISLHDEHRKN